MPGKVATILDVMVHRATSASRVAPCLAIMTNADGAAASGERRQRHASKEPRPIPTSSARCRASNLLSPSYGSVAQSARQLRCASSSRRPIPSEHVCLVVRDLGATTPSTRVAPRGSRARAGIGRSWRIDVTRWPGYAGAALFPSAGVTTSGTSSPANSPESFGLRHYCGKSWQPSA